MLSLNSKYFEQYVVVFMSRTIYSLLCLIQQVSYEEVGILMCNVKHKTQYFSCTVSKVQRCNKNKIFFSSESSHHLHQECTRCFLYAPSRKDYQALRYRNLPQSWLYIRDWTRHHAKRLENEEKSFHVESEKKTKSCTYFVSSVRRTFFCDCIS